MGHPSARLASETVSTRVRHNLQQYPDSKGAQKGPSFFLLFDRIYRIFLIIIFFITFRKKVMKLNPAYIYAKWHKYRRETYLLTHRLN